MTGIARTSACPPILEPDWEIPDCPLCGSRRRTGVVCAHHPEDSGEGPEMAVVRCEECNLAYTSPRPSEAIIGQFYPPDYEPHQPKRSRPRRRARWWRRLRSRLGRFRPARLELAPFGRGRLLDFGCGRGAFLEQMRPQGWSVLGLDCSPDVVRRIREALGLPAIAGTLPHDGLEPESFEVITMWASLEHVHRPLEVLREAHRLLVPGGRLIVSVPNIDSLPFRWFGSAWYGLRLPRHLTHFSPSTLRKMVERAGFTVVSLRMSWCSTWTQRSAELFGGQGRAPRRRAWFRRRLLASLLGRWCLLTRQSDSLVLSARKESR